LWDIEIEQQLKKCTRMLVVLSPHSVLSKNVLDEVSYAIFQEKQIIPILLKECEIPFRLQRLQYINFCGNYDHALSILLATLTEDASTGKVIDKNTNSLSSAGQKFIRNRKMLWVGMIGILALAFVFLWSARNNPPGYGLLDVPENVEISEDSLKLYKDYGILKNLVDSYGDTFNYKGGILKNLPEGYGLARYASFGSMVYTNGNKYIGYWINEEENGKGTAYYSNGCIYNGNFLNGSKDGYGELVDSSGIQIPFLQGCFLFKGNWSNDKKNGLGTCFDSKGKIIYNDRFKNDMPLSKYPSSAAKE
jgi:hypothetical protein